MNSVRIIQPNIFLYFFLLFLATTGFVLALIWPQTGGVYWFIILTAIGGLGVAFYIYRTKKNQRELVCPVGSNCNAVINSRYAKFLGISLEYWGMIYYSCITVIYTLLLFMPEIVPEALLSGLIMISTAAFCFSLYLLFIQALVLRQWCIWCILSASFSIGIFIFSLANTESVILVLQELKVVIGLVQDIGFALGLGGATTAIFLFSRFLRDRHIDDREVQILKGISELIWLGLAFVLVGQFTLYIIGLENITGPGSFFVQTIALLVIAITGAMIMIILTPLLAVIPFEKQQNSPLEKFRKPIFLIGAIGVSSWYAAFFLNYLDVEKIPALLTAYCTAVVIAMIVSLLWEDGLLGEEMKKNSQIT